MKYSINSIALALMPLILLGRADDDLDLDFDDVPSSCKTICRPIATLTDRCDVDLRNDNDRIEDLLQNQCICTNKSFNVGRVAALCADCMHQTRRGRDDHDHNRADRDGIEDINRILFVCGFSSVKYEPAATTEAAGVNVVASAPNNANQLTTTIDRSNPAKQGAVTTGGPVSSPSGGAASTPAATSGVPQPTGSTTMRTQQTPSPTNAPTNTNGGSQTSSTSTTGPASTAGAVAGVANMAYVGVAAIVAGMLV